MNETMNLHEYYRNHKDAINASIMDIACDLAVGRLLNAHGAPFETFVEADDPDDPEAEPITRRNIKRNTIRITIRSTPVSQS